MLRTGLAAAAAAALLSGNASAQTPAGRTVEPKCPPAGCPAPIPVPYPVKDRSAATPGVTPSAAKDGVKASTGDEPGVLQPRPHKNVLHRNINPNPTPPRNPNSPVQPHGA